MQADGALSFVGPNEADSAASLVGPRNHADSAPSLVERGDQVVNCLYATCCEAINWSADRRGSPRMFCSRDHQLLYRSERSQILQRLHVLQSKLQAPATNVEERHTRRVRLELLRQLAHYPIGDLNAYFRNGSCQFSEEKPK